MRVPRDALLDKYASVAPDGAYSSSIPSLTTRFGVVVGGLTNGVPVLHGCMLVYAVHAPPAVWHAKAPEPPLLWLLQPCCKAPLLLSDTQKAARETFSALASCLPFALTRTAADGRLLLAGRMLIGQGAIDACKIGVSIAIRYACARPQFGEQFIMGYLTHQRRLLPALATTYGLHLAMQRCKVLAFECCFMADSGSSPST